MIGDLAPGHGLDAYTGCSSETCDTRWSLADFHCLFDESVRLGAGGQQPLVVIADHFRSGRVVEGHHGQSTGHGFQHHVAEGLRQRGEQEQVGTGVMGSQRLAGLEAGEDRLRQALLKAFAQRAIAHQYQRDIRLHGLHGLVAANQQLDVLFRRQAADMQRDGLLRADAPLATQRFTAMNGREALTIQTASHDPDMLEALLRESGGLGACRDQCQVGGIVEVLQPLTYQGA